MELESPARPLREYLPHYKRGSILLTTRNKQAALRLVEQRDIATVGPMNKRQALALLEKKLGLKEDGNNATELVTALENMPLAIVQTATYISQRVPRYSVAKYLERFRKNGYQRSNRLAHD